MVFLYLPLQNPPLEPEPTEKPCAVFPTSVKWSTTNTCILTVLSFGLDQKASCFVLSQCHVENQRTHMWWCPCILSQLHCTLTPNSHTLCNFILWECDCWPWGHCSSTPHWVSLLQYKTFCNMYYTGLLKILNYRNTLTIEHMVNTKENKLFSPAWAIVPKWWKEAQWWSQIPKVICLVCLSYQVPILYLVRNVWIADSVQFGPEEHPSLCTQSVL